MLSKDLTRVLARLEKETGLVDGYMRALAQRLCRPLVYIRLDTPARMEQMAAEKWADGVMGK